MNGKNIEILKHSSEVRNALKELSMQDFRNFGLHQIAYIRFVEHEGHVVFGADGHEISRTRTLEQAILETKLENLEPVVVH